MSSRVLSAYFDDFRKGKRQREELRRFMEDAIRKEPIRRGHFMGWLDQAQYEHPIPVTEFLLLRREIEATLDNDDQTRIATPNVPVKTAPDAETLVAGDEGATLIAPHTSDDDDATEISSGSQPSDMARLHDVPTLIGSPVEEEDATVINTTHASAAATEQASVAETPAPTTTKPQPSDKRSPGLSPTWLWMSAALIAVAVLLGYWALKPMSEVVVVEPAASERRDTEHTDAELAKQAPATAVNADNTTPEAVITPEFESDTNIVPDTIVEPAVMPDADPLIAELSAAGALELLQQRADAGLLLPLDQAGNAQEVFEFLQAQHPDSPQLLSARQMLKDTYLAASKRAQGKGQWDDSQILLDAAFEVLSATAQ